MKYDKIQDSIDADKAKALYSVTVEDQLFLKFSLPTSNLSTNRSHQDD